METGMHSSTKDRLAPTTSRHNEALEMERRDLVRKFLCDLPKLPSHYYRASTSKEYLEPQFQLIAEIHRVIQEQQAGKVP